MKTISLLLMFLLVLLTGCASAAGSVDDAARVGQAVIKNYGDDVARNSRLFPGNIVLQNSDEVARINSSSLDDILQKKPASTTIDDFAQSLLMNGDDYLSRDLAVIYNTPRSKWTATQRNILEEVKGPFDFNDEDAELFLKSACRTMEYVKLHGKYPSSEYSLFLIHMDIINQELQPQIKEYEEFAESVYEFAQVVIKGQEAEILQKGGETVFNGLCLIP